MESDELFITAGLQDRVVQVSSVLIAFRVYKLVWTMSDCGPLLWKVYEGLVYMDFNQKIMEEQGFGTECTTFLRQLSSQFNHKF